MRVPPVEVSALVRGKRGEGSAQVRKRVLAARARQAERAERLGSAVALNAALPPSELERVVRLDDKSRQLIEGAVTRLGLSARAFGKILRVARTIADLEGKAEVGAEHVSEAIQGRLLDRSW